MVLSGRMFRISSFSQLSKWFIFVALVTASTRIVTCSGSMVPIEGRYSFSLTTFDPTGKLGQVEYAMHASSLGPPTIAVCVKDKGIVFVSLYSLPSPLILDDGSPRFMEILPKGTQCGHDSKIVLAHSGVQADGRVVTAAAQKIAVEYEYTLDESIPIDILLEDLALMFQSYTMKPGTRPFGCSLLLAHTCQSNNIHRLFQIDPSGCTQPLLDGIGVLGKCRREKIRKELIDLKCSDSMTLEEAEEKIIDVLRNDLENEKIAKNNELPKYSFLVAHVTGENVLNNKIVK